MIKITPNEVRTISRYIYSLTGIVLDESKSYLFESRLSRLVQEAGCTSYSEFYNKAKLGSDTSLQRKTIDAITTNETLFFRDQYPFELLRHKLLPDLIDRRSAGSSKHLPVSIRIWSAACATGQEVYSIAMIVKELLPDTRKYNVRILGTDLSDAAITQASYGRYGKFEVTRGLSPEQLKKFFNPNGEDWSVKDEMRAMVTFKRQSLMDSFYSLGKFDIIFCRNVAIYFAKEDRVKLFNKIADSLEEDGCLIVGSSESLADVPRFEPKRYLRTIFYQIRSATSAGTTGPGFYSGLSHFRQGGGASGL